MARAKIEEKREFLMLAHMYEDQHCAGWFMSEKLDGLRAFYEPYTRGMLAADVPWANTGKDHIRVNPVRSTGLWSRYGKVIHAPLWWLDKLPELMLDGELYMGRGKFQETVSVCRKLEPVDSDWERVEYRVFDLPSPSEVFKQGNIRNGIWEGRISGVHSWRKWENWDRRIRFESVTKLLERVPGYVEQEQLPFSPDWKIRVEEKMREVVAGSGEGLMLRHYNSIWSPTRSHNLLKVKPIQNTDVTVIGFVPGKGKLLGLVGAVKVDWNGKQFEISGFTDRERAWGYFKEGQRIWIKYRELTDLGVPKEARYDREGDF